jgi:hypothetical protein
MPLYKILTDIKSFDGAKIKIYFKYDTPPLYCTLFGFTPSYDNDPEENSIDVYNGKDFVYITEDEVEKIELLSDIIDETPWKVKGVFDKGQNGNELPKEVIITNKIIGVAVN